MSSAHRRAFVFTGISFLLVIPAIMLAASFAGMIRYGEVGREIALDSDVVFYISKDMRETIEETAKKSGRWEAHQATKLIIDIYTDLTRTTNISYAKSHSFFPDTGLDPQGRNITTYLKDKIIETMNLRLNETVEELGKRSGKDIIFNDGNEITDELTISQSDPWGFYISVSAMPLFVSGGGSSFNTTLPTFDVYITFEGLEDPYVFVQSEANSFSRIYRSPYEPYNISYAESWTMTRINNLYNVLIGSGTEDNPMPYYHYFGDSIRDDGISFFSRLEGNSTNRPYKIETFLIGDVLMNQSTADRVDHAYFSNANGSAITVCTDDFKDPRGNVFYIDDDHLSYYGLVRSYPCDYTELTISQNDITFDLTIPKESDTIMITATVNNEGNQDAPNVKVQFFNGDPDSGGTQIGNNQTIATIVAGGSGTANVIWTAAQGTNYIYVRVDPDDDFFEPNELNNEAFNDICVNSGLSVTIQTPQGGFSTDNCNTTYVDINATVQDTCFNSLDGGNATVTADISTDGLLNMTAPEGVSTFYGNWGPIINGSAMINITALGNVTTWQGLYGAENVLGYVSNCTV